MVLSSKCGCDRVKRVGGDAPTSEEHDCKVFNSSLHCFGLSGFIILLPEVQPESLADGDGDRLVALWIYLSWHAGGICCCLVTVYTQARAGAIGCASAGCHSGDIAEIVMRNTEKKVYQRGLWRGPHWVRRAAPEDGNGKLFSCMHSEHRVHRSHPEGQHYILSQKPCDPDAISWIRKGQWSL